MQRGEGRYDRPTGTRAATVRRFEIRYSYRQYCTSSIRVQPSVLDACCRGTIPGIQHSKTLAKRDSCGHVVALSILQASRVVG